LPNARSPPGEPGGAFGDRTLVAALARSRPDQGVAVTFLVVEQVRVDRRVERGIVQLEREVVTSLLGALRPGGPDLGSKTRWLGAFSLVRLVSGTIRTPLVWRLGVTISPWKSLPTFLKEKPCYFSLLIRARDHRGLDGDLQAEDDRRRTRPRAGAQRRTSAGRLSCLARNGR
jgi:hypothetical protein